MPEEVDDLARACLDLSHREMNVILDWHRLEGRTLVERGENPDPVCREPERRMSEARVTLRDQLKALLRWARETGRLP